MAKLKVFRTASGFHDSYVAVPSRAAALRAWGAASDLFSMGAAEQVTDPKLMAEPLANPGVVIKRARGTAAEHLAASPAAKPRKAGRAAAAKPPKPKRIKPRPSRTRLDAADKKLAEAKARHDRARDAIDAEIARLEERKRKLRQDYEAEAGKLQAIRDKAEEAYEQAADQWRAQLD